MKTRKQKSQELEAGKKLLTENHSVVFADFTGVDTASLQRLKAELKKIGATFKVIKKRLLRIAFQAAGLDFNPEEFPGAVGEVFLPGEVSDGASVVYKFSRELAKAKKEFKILGAYEIAKKAFLSSEEFLTIAKLPSREILLAQLAGVLSGPIRAFMYLLQEKSKKMVET